MSHNKDERITSPARTVRAELAYQTGMEAIVPPEGREGSPIGNGDGRIAGDLLSGDLRWTFFSGNCAYLLVKQGVNPGPGRHLCTVNPVGVITSDDDAEIWFEGRGFGLRGVDPSAPHLWRMAWTVRFETSAERYSWLNDGFGLWEGTFDELMGRAWYEGTLPDPGR